MQFSSKTDKFDACYHEIKALKIDFKEGKTTLVFNKIDSNVLIGLTTGKSHNDTKSNEIVPLDQNPVVGKKYKIDFDKILIVSVGLKQDGVTANTYEFEYWVQGVETEWYVKLIEKFKIEFRSNRDLID